MYRKFGSTAAYRVILAALVIALGISLVPGRAALATGGTPVLVTCSSDDVKIAPDIYAQTLATYYQNQTVNITGERSADGIWARVSLPDGRLGWMKVVCVGGAVQQPQVPTVPTGRFVTITTGALNVRSGPGWWYTVLGTFYRGATLTLGTHRNADASWVQVVMPDGRTGWVNANYVLSGVPIGSLPVYGAPTAVTVYVGPGATIFNGPGWTYAALASYPHGTALTLGTYRTADSQWIQVVLPDGRTGWLAASYALPSTPISSMPIYGGTPTQPPVQRTHVVQPGENLFRIGLRYGISWPTLAAANGIGYPYRIYAGQVLIIP